MYDLANLIGREIAPASHRKIIDALKRGSKGECEALMEAHLEENILAIRKLDDPDNEASVQGTSE
jgi:DNA-binding GntR family transcriptional regulator